MRTNLKETASIIIGTATNAEKTPINEATGLAAAVVQVSKSRRHRGKIARETEKF